jgi:hypothetical protein
MIIPRLKIYEHLNKCQTTVWHSRAHNQAKKIIAAVPFEPQLLACVTAV